MTGDAMKGVVSILIPAYNYGHYIPETIESILNQTYRNFEIIIVDDGSTDDTANVINKYAAIYPEKIRYFHQKNQGPQIALNTAYNHSKGEYIFFLGADDKVIKDGLEIFVDFLKNHPEYGAVAGDIYHSGIENCIVMFPAPTNVNLLKESIFLTPLIRRSVIEKMVESDGHFFDPDLKYAEDWDLAIRLFETTKIGKIDAITLVYRKHPDSMCRKFAKTYDEEKWRSHIRKKHYEKMGVDYKIKNNDNSDIRYLYFGCVGTLLPIIFERVTNRNRSRSWMCNKFYRCPFKIVCKCVAKTANILCKLITMFNRRIHDKRISQNKHT
ncbi:MAG: glycosyltransferase family A protein [Thermoplasmata archaeon]